MSEIIEMQPERIIVAGSEGGDALAVYEAAGKRYPVKNVPRCKTCKSPYRTAIELALVQGYSYAKISVSMPEELRVSKDSIGNHYRNNHMPLNEESRRLMLEERARELDLDPEEFEGKLADNVTFARMLVSDAFNMLAERKLTPSLRDGLDAAKYLDQIMARAGENQAAEVWIEILGFYWQAVEKVCTPDQQRQISQIIESNPRYPILRQQALKAREKEALEG